MVTPSGRQTGHEWKLMYGHNVSVQNRRIIRLNGQMLVIALREKVLALS